MMLKMPAAWMRLRFVMALSSGVLALGLIWGREVLAQNPDPAQFDEPPEDATIIDADMAKQLAQQDGARIPSADDEVARKRQLNEDEALLRKFFDQRPDTGRRFSLDDPSDDGIVPTGDGNFLHRFRNRAGEDQEVVTLGREFWLGSLASGLRRYLTPENQLAMYRDFLKFAKLYKAPGLSSQRFPSVRRIQRFDVRNVRLLNDRLARKLYLIKDRIKIPLELGPPDCDEETGYDEGRDMSGASCGYRSAGVFQNHNWALKPYLTCVRNQARRGTCVAFAINAGIETTIARRYHTWVTLSEQDLYYRSAGLWYPRFYGDGLWSEGVMENLIDRNYRVPYEEQWDYNPSSSRIERPVGAPDHYENSCVGYDGSEELYCSDTAHQGQRFCFPNPLSWLCFAVPAPETAPAPYRLITKTQLWDIGNPDLSFVKVILTLAIAQRPVVLDIPVYTSWDNVDANGYVRGSGGPLCPNGADGKCHVSSGCECNRGGHAVLAVGFIDNERLPEGAPSGAGGGYFIIKNSWGTCFADGGYIYVPYQWVKNLAGSAVAVSTVSNS